MKIGIAGPISTESIKKFLDVDDQSLPQGYSGAPFLGTLIGALLDRGHTIFAYTTSADMAPMERRYACGHRFKITFCAQRVRSFGYEGGDRGRATDQFQKERNLLLKSFQDDCPDLIHAHWTYEFALAAIECGIPHLVTCHDVPHKVLRYMPSLYRLIRYLMARRVMKHARYFTAVSPYLKREIEKYTEASISIIPNPLPQCLESFSKINRVYNPKQLLLCMVLNGWNTLKNAKPALRAFAALRTTFPNAQLRVIGHGYGTGGSAENWARAHNITNNIMFMGPQSYSAVLSQIADSDLLIHPALEETFGMSVAEALSLGVPVIGGATSGAIPWIIGDSGRLVNVRNDSAILQAATELLSNPSSMSKLSIHAKNTASTRFAAPSIAAAYESCYLKILN